MPSTSTKKVLTSTSQIQKTRRKSIIRIKPSEKSEKIAEVIDHGNQGFSENQLQSYWEQYAKKVKASSGGFSASILANSQPILRDDKKTIHVIFRNQTNELEFGKLSLGLLEFLKLNLKNSHITFTTEVNETKAKKVLYTNRDKFNHFSKTYPKLNDWAQKLGIELK